MPRHFRIGVISDTHGLLRPEALAALHDVDHIIHAGDIGGDGILDILKRIAPVTFVRGNNDDATGYRYVLEKPAGGPWVIKDRQPVWDH